MDGLRVEVSWPGRGPAVPCTAGTSSLPSPCGSCQSACSCGFALGSQGDHLEGVGFVFWSTGSHGEFWAGKGSIKYKKEQNSIWIQRPGFEPWSGTSKLSDLCEPPSLCEGHSGIWHPFLEQRLGAAQKWTQDTGHRGHQENPVVHCSSLVFLSLYVLVFHGCSSKSPGNLVT